MNFNIIYPKPQKPFIKSLADFPYDKNIKVYAENILFIIKISVNELLIWPGVCPHQGSSLEDCVSEGDKKFAHGMDLKYQLSNIENNQKAYIKYGFIFKLNKESIEITNA